MVLSGTVAPITHPYLNADEGASLRVPTPLVINEPEETVCIITTTLYEYFARPFYS